MSQTIALYIDPICPFAWVTSRWLLDAAGATGRDVELRHMSLAVLNEGREMPPPQRAKLDWAHRVGRVFAAATAAGGPGAFGELYDAFGTLLHNQAAEPIDSTVKAALAAADYNPALIDALDDPAWDDGVRAAHQRSQDALGGTGGSPIIAVDGTGFFGPVLTEVPAPGGGIALLEALLTAASTPGFAVLQRPYQGPPTMPEHR